MKFLGMETKEWRRLTISAVTGGVCGVGVGMLVTGHSPWWWLAVIPVILWLGICFWALWVITHDWDAYKESWIDRI